MRLLADECVDRRVCEGLRAAGHEVVEIATFRPGSSDVEVLAEAKRLGLVLLTRDKDFGELVVRHAAESCGVVLLRLRHGEPEAVVDRVMAVLDDHGVTLMRKLVIVVGRERDRVVELTG